MHTLPKIVLLLSTLTLLTVLDLTTTHIGVKDPRIVEANPLFQNVNAEGISLSVALIKLVPVIALWILGPASYWLLTEKHEPIALQVWYVFAGVLTVLSTIVVINNLIIICFWV